MEILTSPMMNALFCVKSQTLMIVLKGYVYITVIWADFFLELKRLPKQVRMGAATLFQIPL